MKIVSFAFLVLMSVSAYLSAEPVSENQLDSLLSVSGLASDIDSMPEMFASTMQGTKAKNDNINDEQVAALVALIKKVINPSFFNEQIKRELAAELSQEDLIQLMAWYESDVGREITLAEEVASTDEGYANMASNAQNIMANSPLVARARQIDIAMNATQQLYTSTKNIGITMYAATSKIDNPNVAVNIVDFSAVLDSQKAEVLNSIEEQITLFIAHSLQDVDDEKIQQYITFLNSPSGKKFVLGSIAGLNTAFEKAMQTFVESINLLFEENEWRLADFLTISPSDDQDLTLQTFPQLELENETLAAWTGDELNFFYNIALQNTEFTTAQFWTSFKKQLRNSADARKVELIHEGEFVTNQGANVEFKIYMWSEDGKAYAQVVNLLYNDSYRYLLQAFPLEITYLQELSVRNVKIMKTLKLAQ